MADLAFWRDDAAEDGEKFAVVTTAQGNGESRGDIPVVESWHKELRDREQD